MSSIEIEKNIPLPARGKFPFGDMAVGDSFLISDGRSSYGGMSAAKKKTGFNFAQRKEASGIRIWRVK